MNTLRNTVKLVQDHISKYIYLKEPYYAWVLALWVHATHVFPIFDAFPYIAITSATKRSGKTRLMEVLATVANDSQMQTAMTAAVMFRMISQRTPVIFFDEAEKLSSESASDMRAVLNTGYRRGGTVSRMVNSEEIADFSTYCPKVFALIGDTFDTLRDRSIIVTMERAPATEELKRFSYDTAQAEGIALQKAIKDNIQEIALRHGGRDLEWFKQVYDRTDCSFLTDRDEEIWRPIFAMCEALYHPEPMMKTSKEVLALGDKIHDLTRVAVDMCAEKTADARDYRELEGIETQADNNEYAVKLLADCKAVTAKLTGKWVTTERLLALLRDCNTAPWRKFRGKGLDAYSMSDLLSRFGIRPTTCSIKGHKAKGYELDRIKKGSL